MKARTIYGSEGDDMIVTQFGRGNGNEYVVEVLDRAGYTPIHITFDKDEAINVVKTVMSRAEAE